MCKMSNLRILIVSLQGCEACNQLIYFINELVMVSDTSKPILIEVLNISNPYELALKKLNIKLFPTILAFKNSKIVLGWEGFAALAPDEIKREMVEDVLRQVAALADEDDGGGDLLHNRPQQVRHDN